VGYVRFRVPSFVLPAAIIASAVAVVAGSSAIIRAHEAATRALLASPADPPAGRYLVLAARSIGLLEHSFYNGSGLWHMCVPSICNTKNRDWGADALTNDLYLGWRLTGNRSVLPYLRHLALSAHLWIPSDHGSSDTPAWDAVADIREYQATGSRAALAKAEAAFGWVTGARARPFATGACPAIDYQWGGGRRSDLKTLETGSNLAKAGLLLYQITGQHRYLAAAEAAYAAARRYFLSRASQLYTAYILDNGRTCKVLPGLYYASVNGNMIWDGTELARITGDPAFLRQAIATAQAVRARLSDGAGVFADLQADNDITGPLVEGMYALATDGHQRFARRWLMTAASAAGADIGPGGTFGRFFDGPPPAWLATAWQVSGGVALMQAAAALDPHGAPAAPGFWRRARFVPDGRSLTGPVLRITFTGRAIAILGTLGARCCSPGHARVFVDGTETFNRVGIWQDKSSPAIQQFDQVLFAWRWRRPGRHTIAILPGIDEGVLGGSFFSMIGYLLVR